MEVNRLTTLQNIETKHFTFANPPDKLRLESGEKIGPITLAYETYGDLNKEKSNAVLVAHALSGDAHAAGQSKSDGSLGWWARDVSPTSCRCILSMCRSASER